MLESGARELAEIIIFFFECARDATDPEQNAFANFGKHFATRYDVGNSEAAAWLQHTKSFAEDRVFVGRKIDHANGYDDIYPVVGQRNMLDFASETFDVLDSGFFLVLGGEGEHFVGHVEAVGFSGGADAARGKQNVDAAAGAEVENGFTSVELGERGGIRVAERSQHRLGWDLAGLRGVVKI